VVVFNLNVVFAVTQILCGRGVERGVSQRQFPTYGLRFRPFRQQNASYYTKISRRRACPGSLPAVSRFRRPRHYGI